MSFAANAYARTARSVLSPREAEAAVLIKAARQLEMVRDDWTNESANLGKALTFNQKVWTLLATDATESTSELPGEVKQGVAKLAVFVFRRTLDAMVERDPEKLSALISINHNIASGLQGR